MADVRALLDLSDNGERSSVDGCELARAHLDKVRAKINALRAMEDVLQRISDACTDTIAEAALASARRLIIGTGLGRMTSGLVLSYSWEDSISAPFS